MFLRPISLRDVHLLAVDNFRHVRSVPHHCFTPLQYFLYPLLFSLFFSNFYVSVALLAVDGDELVNREKRDPAEQTGGRRDIPRNKPLNSMFLIVLYSILLTQVVVEMPTK